MEGGNPNNPFTRFSCSSISPVIAPCVQPGNAWFFPPWDVTLNPLKVQTAKFTASQTFQEPGPQVQMFQRQFGGNLGTQLRQQIVCNTDSGKAITSDDPGRHRMHGTGQSHYFSSKSTVTTPRDQTLRQNFKSTAGASNEGGKGGDT